jgi:hypothetical protein
MYGIHHMELGALPLAQYRMELGALPLAQYPGAEQTHTFWSLQSLDIVELKDKFW